MKEETFEKARYLHNCIADINSLLHSEKAQYDSMLIKVSCANSNMYDDYWGRINKETWDKMLAVLTEERDTLKRKLAALINDSEDNAEQIAFEKVEIIITRGQKKGLSADKIIERIMSRIEESKKED